MPNQISRQPEARSTSRVVNIPTSGMSRLMLTPGQHLEFSFDPAGVTFSRSGTDLVIAGTNGAGVTLNGFFVVENADSLPQFILPGGDSVPASAYLQSLNIDITTAAGPTPTATPPSGGEGEYADGAGDLLGGVDRLGSLGTDQWAGPLRAAETPVTIARGLDAGGPDAGPDAGPDVPPTPVEPPIFNARAVLYMQNEGEAPNGQPYGGRGVTVQALAKNGNGQWEASGQEAASIQAHEGNTLDVDSLLEYTMDRDGNITFRLTAAGKAWMAAGGKDMTAYYTITDANGNFYVIQVVISADERFNSAHEHNENLDPNGLAHGEWHEGKDLSQQTGYKTVASNLDDRLTFSGMVTGADIKTGYAADSDDWGKDTVVFNGSVNTTLKGTSTPIYTDPNDPSLQTGTRTVHNEKSGNNVIETGREGTVTINYTAKTGDGSGAAVRAVAAEDGTTYNRGYQPGSSAHVTDEAYSYSNTITSGAITIKADGGDTDSAVGVYGTGVAGQEGGNRLTALNGDIRISAALTQNHGEALGVGSRDADSIFKASRDVSIEAKAGGGTGSATAVSWIMSSDASHVDKEYSIKAGRDVNLKATNGYGAGGLIVRSSGHYGVVQATGDADNPQALVEAGNNVNITAVSHGGTGNLVGAVGVDAEQTGGVTTVIRAVEGNITVDAQAGRGGARGVSNVGYGGYTSLFLEAKNGTVDITAKNTGTQYGNVTGLRTLGGNSNVDVDGNRQCDANTTSVTAKNINIRATDNSGLSEAMALAASGGRNELSATGDGQNLFSAAGGKTSCGLFAQGGEGGPGNHKGGIPGAHGSEGVNSITALNGEVRVEASGDTAYGTYARGGNAGHDGWVAPDTLVGGTGGEASNNIIAKNVTITATAVDAAYGLYTQNGSSAFSSGKGGGAATTITATESATITASGDKAWGVFAKGGEASNTIKSDARLTVTAEGKTLAQGAAARGDGALTELSSRGRMDITATTTGPGREDDASARAEAGAFGLYAADGGKVTAETKDLHITATAKGEQWAVGARAEDGGSVELTGRDIKVKAQVEAVDKTIAPRVHAFALETYNGDITVNMTGHSRNTLLLEAENRLQTGKANGDNFAAGIFAEGKSHVLIKGDKNATNQITIKTVTGEGGSVGVYTFGKDSDVSILGGDKFDDIIIDAASNTGGAVGIRVSENTSDVRVDTGKGDDLVTIRAHSSGQSDKTYSHAYGLQNMGGAITVKSLEGSVDIGAFSNKSNSYAVSAAGPTAVNTVEARRVDLKGESNEGAARGMHAQQCATNQVSGWESVTVEAKGGTAHGLYAETGASNYVTGKAVKITATGTSSAAGLYAAGGGTLNSVSALKGVTITATGKDALGVHVKDGARADITAKDVTIAANGSASGSWARGLQSTGGTIAVHSTGGTVQIDAHGTEAYAMSAEGGNGSSVLIKGAKKVILNGDNTGMSANAGTNTIDGSVLSGDEVSINAAVGMWASGRSGGTSSLNKIVDVDTVRIGSDTNRVKGGMAAAADGENRIENAKHVEIRATEFGMDAKVQGAGTNAAHNIIKGNGDMDVSIDVVGAAGQEAAYGMANNVNSPAWANRNEISGANKVNITVSGANDNFAMFSGGGEGNFIAAKDVTLKASAAGATSQYSAAVGMHATLAGTNSIDAEGNVGISASSGGYANYGMNAQQGGVNTVTAKGDVEITTTGGHFSAGMNTAGLPGVPFGEQGGNTITAGGDVRIKASGGFSNTGMYAAYFGANEIAKAASVTVTAEGAGAGVNAAMHADGGQVRGAVGAVNSIHDIAGAVKLIAQGAVGESSLAFRQGSIGMLAVNGARNLIYNAESVEILAQSPDEGYASYGMSATGGASAPNPPATNHIHDITGKVSITAEGGKNAYGMSASVSGVNRIENTGRVEITAEGAEKSYAMHATSCGTNTIINTNGDALIVVIKATGGSLGNYAMFAETESRNEILGGDGNDVISLKGDISTDATGKNVINTGAGDDRIELDGKVTGNFTLDAGDGYDILVLRASSWAEFTDRYQAWLTANFDTMNIESIQWALNNPSGAVPGWLQDLVDNYNNLHPDAPVDLSPAALTDLAHIVAGDMNNIIEHDGDVSAVHTTQHADDGHGPAAFGDGDDYVHVKGNVDHVDFRLGGGHNILHIDGNALSDIFGGHDGNDIRVGGSFGGVIDLGSGGDRVALGGLHNGEVSLGAGDDHLVLSSFTGGTVDGGSGHDILTLNLGGHGGNAAFTADGTFSGLFTPGAVQNFEELHFNLSGGGDDSLEIDGLLDSLRGLTAGTQTTVRITGDAGSDHVDTQALASSGWISSVDPVTGDTRWTHAGPEDENLIILIQNGLN